jgi:hypothetical protein
MDKLQAIANRDNLPVWLIINRMIDDLIYEKADNSLYDELEDLPSRGA